MSAAKSNCPHSVSEHKIPWRTLRSATVTEISAQLPESNPILEHPTLLAGRSVSVRLQLGRLKPVGQILCLYQHKEWWMRPAWVEHFCDIPERTQLVLWKSAKAWHVMMPVFRHEMRVDIRGDGRGHNDLLLDVSTNQVGRVQLQGPLLVHRQSDRKVEDPYELIRGCAEWVMSQNGGLGRLWKQTLPESLRGFGWCRLGLARHERERAGHYRQNGGVRRQTRARFVGAHRRRLVSSRER